MATIFRAAKHPAPESDYGDFDLEEESIVLQLLESLQTSDQAGTFSNGETKQTSSVSQVDLAAAIAAEVFTSALNELDHEDVATSLGAEVGLQGNAKAPASRDEASRNNLTQDVEDISFASMDGIEYPDLGRALSKLSNEPLPAKSLRPAPAEDKRSPLERFRKMRPLSVSDISSGSWCELQQWYILTQLPGGRKPATAAMKAGTKVHQTLEDQVHFTVQVNISLKEEGFALRLWNFVQGLRTLRDTGLTRELEVWGVVEGQEVNGVIDELSYTSPNLGFEEELSQSQSSQSGASDFVAKQSSITEYFDPHKKRIYLSDTKTRGTVRLPTGAAIRPSRVQLFMYHRLLGDMAAGRLDFATILSRYGLNPDVRFSDAFMAQIGSLHDEVFDEVEPGEDAIFTPPTQSSGQGGNHPGPTPDHGTEAKATTTTPPPDLIKYRTIQQILPLVQAELHQTFPQGADSLGDLVAVVYRHREDGRIIGNHCFPVNPQALDNYLKLNLSWWLGKRNPDGVPIEEAYKCRRCEFVDSCEWRQEKSDEAVRKSRKQTDGGRQSQAALK